MMAAKAGGDSSACPKLLGHESGALPDVSCALEQPRDRIKGGTQNSKHGHHPASEYATRKPLVSRSVPLGRYILHAVPIIRYYVPASACRQRGSIKDGKPRSRTAWQRLGVGKGPLTTFKVSHGGLLTMEDSRTVATVHCGPSTRTEVITHCAMYPCPGPCVCWDMEYCMYSGRPSNGLRASGHGVGSAGRITCG